MEISLSNNCYWRTLIGDFFTGEFCWRFFLVDLLLDIFLYENVYWRMFESFYWRMFIGDFFSGDFFI